MAGVNPISPLTPPPISSSPAGAAQGDEGGPKVDLARSFGDLVEQVDAQQEASAVSVRDLVAGRNTDVLGVVSEMAKADLSFKLLIGVRNKIIEAYKQTMNMQV